MKIQIFYLDKLKFNAEKDLAEKYLGRIQFLGKKLVNPLIIKQINLKELELELAEKNYNVLLDERGKSLDTLEFANLIFENTQKKISFFIGSTDGFDEIMRKKGDFLLSISTMTLTHSFATIILLEQIYRSITIKINHPYHKN